MQVAAQALTAARVLDEPKAVASFFMVLPEEHRGGWVGIALALMLLVIVIGLDVPRPGIHELPQPCIGPAPSTTGNPPR